MPATAATYQDTRVGKLYADPAAPFLVQQSAVNVFQMDRTVDIPTDVFTADSIFKYFSTDSQVNTPSIHLNFDLQSGMTGSDWTSVKHFAREIGKSTLTESQASPFPAGIMGTFTFPLSDATHYRVMMKTYGGDSTGSFNMVVGMSNEHFYRDTPRGA